MVNEFATLVALVAANVGAIGTTIESWYSSPEHEKYSQRLLVGAILGSSLAAFTVVNLLPLTEQVSTIGYLGIAVTNAIVGIGAAKLFHRTNKNVDTSV